MNIHWRLIPRVGDENHDLVRVIVVMAPNPLLTAGPDVGTPCHSNARLNRGREK